MHREQPIQVIDRSADRRARRGGFTLLEGLIASVVLAILVLGVVGSVSTSYQESQSVRATATSVTLGRQLVDEIVSKPFDSTDALGTGGTRSTFTNISAYNNYSDTSNALPLLAGGTIDATGADQYTRQTSVVAGAQPSNDAISPTSDFAIVTVNVAGPGGEVISIPEFVARYTVTR
jgi:type II secretory pathway pseudopilin PulG